MVCPICITQAGIAFVTATAAVSTINNISKVATVNNTISKVFTSKLPAPVRVADPPQPRKQGIDSTTLVTVTDIEAALKDHSVIRAEVKRRFDRRGAWP